MDKLHYYVCQTDINLCKYIERAERDAKNCKDTFTLSLMKSCSKDVESKDDEDDEDDEEEEDLVVDNEVEDDDGSSDESDDDEDDDDEDGNANADFVAAAIGAGRGQLRQVPTGVSNFVVSLLPVLPKN